MTHTTQCLRGRIVIVAQLIVVLAAAPLQAEDKVCFDFETGDLQGWTVVEGRFGKIVFDRDEFKLEPGVKYNKQGKYFLSTLANPEGHDDDKQTGVIESPVFVPSGKRATFLVGGGAHDKHTYVALCTEDGKEVLRVWGRNSEHMLRVTWDVSKWIGKRVYMKVVDRHTGGWGHTTFDDFCVQGMIDPEATQARAEARKRRALEAARNASLRILGPTREAVEDLIATHAGRYPDGQAFLAELADLERQVKAASLEQAQALSAKVSALQCKALLANPLVREHPILFVVRQQYRPDHHATATMFQNGEINTNSFQGGGAMKALDLAGGGKVTTLLDVPKGIARDPEISFDGKKILFSMRKDKADDYHVYEMNVDGTGLRQLTEGSALSDIDPIYLPDGKIVLASTREPKLCQCNRHIMANLFKMDADGSNLHQIGRNTLFEGHPFLMPDGTILYDRWEYVDKQFGPAFGLWTVNPDGTNHAIFYGNNAWSPGAILDARIVPGTQQFVATFGSCHDRPWGAIAVVDRTRALDGLAPVVKSWPADISGQLGNNRDYPNTRNNGHPAGWQIDTFRGMPIKYEDPYPLSDKYFLCSRIITGESTGVFLIDVFGNEVLVHAEPPGCFDPMPIMPRPRPPIVPDRKRLAGQEGYYYVADVYVGTGMDRVERGAVKWIRVVEAPPKLFWTHTLWNIDATQAPAMNWNCTNNKRIIGKAPVEPDGSAYFAVPADKFIFFQLLDKDDMMVQSMRSGTMVQPGETTGCVGCHDNRLTSTPNDRSFAAMRRGPNRLDPWYGPPREFNYLTEVQPVFDKHCVTCHDYDKPAGKKLNLAGDVGLVFNTSYIELRSKSALRWFPDPPGAPKLLVKAVDDGPAEALPPYAWGSHRSKLVDVIRGDHNHVKLTKEELDRIVTWIDMNAVYYGSYASAYPHNRFGRSPLNDQQLKRLKELTGAGVGDQGAEMRGSQVSFARPELSPCLARLKDKNDPRYAEAIAIIRAGTEKLAKTPRMDMPGAKLVGIECQRQAKYDTQARIEAKTREEMAQANGQRSGATY
ncbi:MAG: hypothetical protein JXQ73_17435 [Phycisphaerae bacterium]|nr:hypothetical protein [Phycisphaerae bacterium]